MFYVKNHKQANTCDPWGHLGPKRRKLLNKSWSGLFQQKILPTLPVDALRKHYHEWNGRPTKELYSMIGMMILQQMHDLTDDEAVEQFCFNIQYHYALNITSPTDAAAYISHKTLWTMRDKLSTEEIYQDIFKSTLKTLEKLFQADLKKQRMDSVHIQSNMRHLGRIGLFVRTIKKFLTNLKRHQRGLYDKIDGELVNRYMGKRNESLFAMVKPSESSQTLDQLVKARKSSRESGKEAAVINEVAKNFSTLMEKLNAGKLSSISEAEGYLSILTAMFSTLVKADIKSTEGKAAKQQLMENIANVSGQLNKAIGK